MQTQAPSMEEGTKWLELLSIFVILDAEVQFKRGYKTKNNIPEGKNIGKKKNLDGVEFFALIFLYSELLALIVVLISVVFSLDALSSLPSLPLLWVLCITHWDHDTSERASGSFHDRA